MGETKVKKSRGKKALKVIGVILAVIVVLVAILAVVNVIGNKANESKAQSFEKVKYENQLKPEKDSLGNWTFTTDNGVKVMQLTDVHIGGGFLSFKKDAMAINCVAAMISAEKPDLVIVTGDIAYPVPFQAGTFNNKVSAKIFAELMESLGVYWSLGFGNHDTELYSYFTREQIADLYTQDKYSYCLFSAGPEDVDGTGNQIINVKNSQGKYTQSFYILDSHSYTDGDYFGAQWKYDNIHENQVQWYKENVEKYNELNGSAVKSLMFFHIPLTEYKDAWYEFADNGFKDTDNVKVIYGVAGESKKVVYPGVNDDNMFETIQALGSTMGVFCGHDHYNNFSLDYKGTRLTYGKSVDYLAYPGIYKIGAQRGCTIIDVAPDGSFDCHAESYYQDKYTSLYEKEPVDMAEQTTVPIDEKYK